jgi:diguanylate cyclase (GGDEF)-like protein/PAS domain S-box-containing protein
VTVPASRASGPERGVAPLDAPGPLGALARMSRVVTALRDIAVAPADPAQVFRVLADSVLTVFPAEGAIASQPDGDEIVARATGGFAGPPVGHRIPQDGTLGGLALRTLEPQLCVDSRVDPRTMPDVSASARTRSSITVPLVHEGACIALIAAVSSHRAAFDEDDLALLGMLADVAASRVGTALAESARSALEAHQAALVDVMADGLIVQDRDGRIVLTNAGAQQILGFSGEHLTGRTSATEWRMLWDDGTERSNDMQPSILAMATGEPRRDDVLGLDAGNGHVQWLNVSSVPVRDAAGELTGVVSAFTDITARRTARELRLARQRRLHAAQELTGLAWWELDVASGAHTWSDEMFHLVGLDPREHPPTFEEYVGLLHPDDRAAARELRRRGYGTGHRDVFRVVHPDGTIRHLQSWTDVELGDAAAVTTVFGATIDVTDREEALASVAVSRASLAAAIDLTRTATWERDLRTGRVEWSDRMSILMGRDPEAPAPSVEDFLRCVHPEDRERMRALGERTVATGTAEEAVYRVVHTDGSEHHVRAWTDVRRDRDGAVTHLWGTAMDITTQEESAALLAESEEHFRVAFDNAPIGMSMIGLAADDQGRYLRTNAAFQQMLGRSHAELAGVLLGELTHPEDRDRDAERFAKLLRGELSSLAFEKRYLHADGHVVHAWITSSVVYGTHGEQLYLVTHAVDISDRLREQAELERLALTDTLTGLANRTLLNDRVDQALARLHRRGGAVAMLLLDIDRFKTVNDSLGHQVGDALLVEMAGRIEAVTRAESTVARLGGDEFVVLVEGLPAAEAVHAVADRLLETLRRPFDLGPAAESLVATVSIGISLAVDDAGRTPGDLYREADLALYRAKDSGRDQYALFDDELRARADRRLAAETLLRRALAENLLVPVFQPIVDLVDGKVHAAEALVRIQDGDRLLLPADFIDVAEETGLIVEVDARMFERVAAECARLLDSGVLLRRLTTNVSARSLEDHGFVPRLQKALRWHGVPGSMVRIELTERSLLAASPTVKESLARIHDMGVAVGLDDFGTGYSALAYLQSFQMQFLKIDRSFVSRLGTSARDDAVVAAVIDLAHAHELVVVGEGVETPEQLAALRRMGCDRAQGYLMGRPMSAAALDELLSSDPVW